MSPAPECTGEPDSCWGFSLSKRQSFKHESIRLKARIGIYLHIAALRSDQVKHEYVMVLRTRLI